ncbi:hypothetical protein MP638_005256 [Amoeboaphelidium occidentale]|nr:hypothetical protein MP638_005256 [Amoeboaphelidium occidentale]
MRVVSQSLPLQVPQGASLRRKKSSPLAMVSEPALDVDHDHEGFNDNAISKSGSGSALKQYISPPSFTSDDEPEQSTLKKTLDSLIALKEYYEDQKRATEAELAELRQRSSNLQQELDVNKSKGTVLRGKAKTSDNQHILSLSMAKYESEKLLQEYVSTMQNIMAFANYLEENAEDGDDTVIQDDPSETTQTSIKSKESTKRLAVASKMKSEFSGFLTELVGTKVKW